jgi:hypothetical protein
LTRLGSASAQLAGELAEAAGARITPSRHGTVSNLDESFFCGALSLVEGRSRKPEPNSPRRQLVDVRAYQ